MNDAQRYWLKFSDALREGHENGRVVTTCTGDGGVVTICAPKIGREFDSRVGPVLVIDGRRYSVEAAKQLHAELGQALGEVLP